MAETMKRTIQGAERAAMPLGLILLMIGVFSRVCRYMRWSALSFGESGKAVLFDLEPAKMLWGAALILLLLSALRRPDAKAFRIDMPLKILLAFVALAVASLMWSYDARFALVWVIRLYVPVSIYVLVSSYTRTARDVRAWIYLFAFMGLAAFVFAAYETFIVVGAMGMFIKDGVGGDQYVGEYARWSVIGFAFGAYFALYPRKLWERLGGLAVMACTLGTVYFTYRRSAVLCIGVVVLTYLFTIGMRRRVLWVVPLLAVLGLAAIMGANPYYARRLATIPIIGGHGGIENFGEHERLDQFMAGLATAREHWTHGIGFGATMLYFQKVRHVGMTLPHNIVVRLIGELGVVGFGLYMAFLGSGILRTWRVYRYSLATGDERQAGAAIALLASTLAILFYAMFEPILYDTFFYILIAVSSCMFSVVIGQPAVQDHSARPA